MRYCVLGATGFVGRHLADRLEGLGADVLRLSRPSFDLTRPEVFAAADLDGRVILDCAARIDGPEESVRAVVVDGLAEFLAHLRTRRPGRYVYFSTASTLRPEITAQNAYVRAKQEAEDFVRQIPDARIIRLSFPFGIGENPERLVSRLIRKALAGERLALGNVALPLTPIDFLAQRLPALLEAPGRESNFTDGRLYHLRDVARAIFAALDLPEAWDEDPARTADLSVDDPDIHPGGGALDMVRRMCALAKSAATGKGRAWAP
jgi:nucleoside-diphosphate-sugar epimerase